MREVNIGGVIIKGYAALAPLSGVADTAFRCVCREKGACYSVSEMISAKALTYKDKKFFLLSMRAPGEKPFALQLFGSEPDIMSEGTKIACESVNPEIVDINMGCPVNKVASNGEGSALMKNPVLAGKIAEAVVKAADCPVTVKIRTGWDEKSKNAFEIARICAECGVSAITIHGRTREMMYSGKAEHETAAYIKQELKIPVIISGDIFSGAQAEAALNISGADLVMIGRGAFGNPWIFEEINDYFEGREFTPPSVHDKMDMLIRQTLIAAELKGEISACKEARKHAMWYVKGIRDAAAYKESASHISSLAELRKFADNVKSANN